VSIETEQCEVAIVGAGPAGVSCGLVLARAGVDVVILERGRYPGAKNMFGGVLLSDQLSKMLPEFYREGPIERFVAKRRHSLLVDESEIALSQEFADFKDPPYNHSFVVKRPAFDKWFADQAQQEGAVLLTGVAVESLLREDGRITGVKAGPGGENRLPADVVVCAEGANCLLAEKAGLRSRLSMRARSVAVKEVLRLPRETIEERFGLTGREGAAYEYFSDSVGGMLGNGFIYTNLDSISVGIGVIVSELYARPEPLSPNDLLDRFKCHPCVRPLIKGGETVEYSAHMIPAESHEHTPELCTDGLMLVGDAAGLVDNSPIHHQGVNLAIASGVMAAETILGNREERRYDRAALKSYERRLSKSFIRGNLRDSQDLLDFMRTHTEFLNDYPNAVKSALVKFFEVDDVPAKAKKRHLLRELRRRIDLKDAAKIAISQFWSAI